MADERTRIIIKEIEYWKEHKLLPEVQCDFLLALYTQGEGNVPSSKEKHRVHFIHYFYLTLLVLVVPFSFLVVYFTQFNFILQLSILILFLGYSIWVFWYNHKRKTKEVHLSLMIMIVLSLIITDFIANLLQFNQLLTVILILGNFIGWFLLSKRFHYRYLMISSFLAIIIVLFVNFSHLFSFN